MREKAPVKIQPKFAVSSPGDICERDADDISEQVMRMPEPRLQRACACGGGCPTCRAEQPHQEHERLQAKRSGSSDPEQTAVPPIVHEVLRSPGQPLDAATHAFFAPHFGDDLSRVRVHAGEQAAKSADQVHARAYTVGHHVVFGVGQYAPKTRRGRQLIAHELTHVVQQGATCQPGVLYRQGIDQPLLPPDPRDIEATSAPKGKKWSGGPPKCGPDFCRPLPTQRFAEQERDRLWPMLTLGIALKVSNRVISLWNEWAYGGSSVKNLTKDFGGDFFASATTAKTTNFLLGAIQAKLTASPPTVSPGGFLKRDIPTLIPEAVKAINDPSSPDHMNFNEIGEIPGNIAGGIGRDQAATPIGATPSPQNDERIAKGDVTVFDAGANLMAMPNLSYTVKDTIDLCPGDCGAGKERIATIPMSQWEATGISGDVPFTVDFLAPTGPTPLIIPKPSAPAPAPSAPAPAPKKP